VIVMSAVDMDATTTEELLQGLECGEAFGTLGHDELREDLPSKLHHSASLNRHGEASFPVNETNDPSNGF
jgi:hypothetical protein